MRINQKCFIQQFNSKSNQKLNICNNNIFWTENFRLKIFTYACETLEEKVNLKYTLFSWEWPISLMLKRKKNGTFISNNWVLQMFYEEIYSLLENAIKIMKLLVIRNVSISYFSKVCEKMFILKSHHKMNLIF